MLVFLLFVHENICCGYSLEAPLVLLMSTFNICFCAKKKNNFLDTPSYLELCSCIFFPFLFCRETFFSIVKEQCQTSFKVHIDKVLGHLSRSGTVVDDNVRSLFFGDYMSAENKTYNEVSDLKELTAAMEK